MARNGNMDKANEPIRDLMLSKIIDAIPDVFYVLDLNGNLIAWNRELMKKTGYSPVELNNKPATAFVAGDEQDVVVAAIQRAIEAGYADVEVNLLAKTGETTPCQFTATLIKDEKGAATAIAGIGRDITGRKRQEEAVKEAMRKNESLVGAIGHIIYEHYLPEDRVVWSGDYQARLGFSEDEMGNSSEGWFEKVHPEDLEAVKSELERAARTATKYDLTYRFLRKGGEYSWFHDRGVVTKNSEEDKTSIIGLMEDIDSRKKMEEKYRCLFESSRDAIMTMEPPSWEFTDANTATLRMFKSPDKAAFLSKPPWELSPDVQPVGSPSPEKAKEMIGKAMDEGSHFFEWSHIRSGGEEFDASVLLTRVEIESGQPFLQATAREITESKKAAAEMKKMAHDLGERLKELNCLYSLSTLLGNPRILLDEGFQDAVNLIPPAWQYPEITCGRIVFENKEFKTAKFMASEWKQSSDITEHGNKVGVVEVFYMEERPQDFEGPFLKEERALIDAIAERLGKSSERWKTENELRNRLRQLEIFQKATVGRELKMKELKERVAELEAEIGDKL